MLPKPEPIEIRLERARRHIPTSKVQTAQAFAARWNDADRDGFTLD